MTRPARMAAAVLMLIGGLAAAEEFKFDASEFEKKPLEFSGYFEQKEEGLKLQGDTPAYKLAYPGDPGQEHLLRSTSTLNAGGKWNLDPFVADLRFEASYAYDGLLHGSDDTKVMDGGLRWSSGPDLTLDLGKRVQRWGKGYAWTTVGFIERPKDSSDPQASREGLVMASGEWTKRMTGPISAIGLAAFSVPTNDRMNEDFGTTAHLNPAAKLYLLALDTDIDLMWRGKGARPESYGFDFSRNLNTALEVHGEWARTLDAPRNTMTATGTISSRIRDSSAWLLGMRYLTPGEVTWIGEYYHNGGGYSEAELDDFYQFLDTALATDAAPALVSKAQRAAQAGYGKSNPGQDYLYVKASVSEPFDWVYGAASLTAMTNLNDGSWQITPEVNYTGFKDIELRARLILLGGPPDSEFTEKSVSDRLEVYARFYF